MVYDIPSHMPPLIARLAPTPSGLLHLGNLLNFVLNWALIKKHGGELHLRIDDIDFERCRPEYIEDIFNMLDLFQLEYTQGPRGLRDFTENHSMLLKTEFFRQQLNSCQQIYTCQCSRKEVAQTGSALYPLTCLNKNLVYQPKKNCIRISTDGQVKLGDFVVWRKQDLPSYMFASTVDDIDRKTNLIVRGEDLENSTQAQIFLSRQLPKNNFSQVHFIHHPLLLAPNGEKFSKSKHHMSLAQLKKEGKSASQILALLVPQFTDKKYKYVNLNDFVEMV